MNCKDLKEIFSYKDGSLYWKISNSNRIKIGDQAGSLEQTGYLITSVNGKKELVHRVIFAMHHGYLPEFVDHIDRNPLNNCIENLRPATKAENCRNQKRRADNSTGARGVVWDKQRNKWRVAISINNKTKYIGRFDDFELAELVAIEARSKYYGAYANI